MCEIFLSSFIMCYFFCIRSSSISCTVPKVVHVTAKIIQNSKRGRKKKQYVVRRGEAKAWKIADKYYVIFYMSKIVHLSDIVLKCQLSDVVLCENYI